MYEELVNSTSSEYLAIQIKKIVEKIIPGALAWIQ